MWRGGGWLTETDCDCKDIAGSELLWSGGRKPCVLAAAALVCAGAGSVLVSSACLT